jgi:hypothetical protein
MKKTARDTSKKQPTAAREENKRSMIRSQRQKAIKGTKKGSY